MIIKLLELSLSNFKGVKEQKLVFNGNNVEIHGKNASGKTTVYDAFLWLLFGKDSEGKSAGGKGGFEIKRLTHDNKHIHKLEHVVVATLDIDGTITSLKKVYKEKWTKKHGELEQALDNNTTDYWIDDVPIKKKDYDAYINNIINETTFKLLTDVRYFTEKIKWKDRRVLLEQMAAFHMNPVEMPPDLSLLIGNKSLEDYKKIIAEKKKKLKKELEAIPIRVDELNKNLPDIQGIDFESVRAQIKELEFALDQVNNQGVQIIEHNNKLFDLKSQLRRKELFKRDLEEQLSKDANKEYEQALRKEKDLVSALSRHQNNKDSINMKIDNILFEIPKFDTKIEKLREGWANRSKEAFNESTLCPTCKQELPETGIEKLKQRFEDNKKDALEDITSAGKNIKARKEELEQEKEQLIKDIKNIIDPDIDEFQLELKVVQKVIDQGRSNIDFNSNPAWITLESEINDLNVKITDFKELDTSTLDTKKFNVKLDISSYNDTLSKQTQFDLAMDRQKKLLEEEKNLAKSINELDKQEFQIQEYTMKKINALGSTVNSMFKNVKFKMFDYNTTNDGVGETCEVLINGVPYSSANYAGRINAGLDIINTLSKEYGIKAVVFVDNSESVTELMDLEQQMIKLVVDKNYKKLTIMEEI